MAFLVDENVHFVEIAVGALQRELFKLFQLRYQGNTESDA
jgi:hypothetical protein